MPRSPRLIQLGIWYHITARGIEQRPIFKDHRDRAHFLELLAELTERFRVRLFAYVLMDNHYHLLLELREPNLSEALRWLNLSYSAWFNRRHDRAGYLFQGRFKSFIIDPDTRGYHVSAYIHLNPVRTTRHALTKTDRQHHRAGVGAAPTADQIRARLAHLREYPWNSYPAYAGLVTPPPWLDTAAVFKKGGGAKTHQRQAYRRYVENQLKQGHIDSPWNELQDRIYLGSVDFLDRLKKQARLALKKKDPTPAHLRERIPLQTIIQAVEKTKNDQWPQFKNRHADGGLALVLTLARKHSGLTLSALAQKLDLKPSANPSMIIQRYQQRLHHEPAERALATHAAQILNAMT